MPIDEMGRNDAHDPIVILACHGEEAEEALLAEPDARLALDRAESACHIGNKEAPGIGPTRKIDAYCPAHGAVCPIAAAEVLNVHCFDLSTRSSQLRAHSFFILLQP